MAPHIYSTLSADTEYTGYVPKSEKEGGANVPERVVRIKGGANVADPRHLIIGKNVTPAGHRTTVTKDELEFLKGNHTFQTHMKHGFVKFLEGGAEKVDKVVKDMKKADKSAPMTDADYDEKNPDARGKGPAPTTGEPPKKEKEKAKGK